MFRTILDNKNIYLDRKYKFWYWRVNFVLKRSFSTEYCNIDHHTILLNYIAVSITLVEFIKLRSIIIRNKRSQSETANCLGGDATVGSFSALAQKHTLPLKSLSSPLKNKHIKVFFIYLRKHAFYWNSIWLIRKKMSLSYFECIFTETLFDFVCCFSPKVTQNICTRVYNE